MSIPGLIPTQVDIGDPSPTSCLHGTLIIDFESVIGKLLASRSEVCNESVCWSPCWRGDLASAISGGQWTQVRKAAVPAWNIADKNCQLCGEAVGTLEHRYLCSVLLPALGWHPSPQEAILARGRVGHERLRILETRGVLAL